MGVTEMKYIRATYVCVDFEMKKCGEGVAKN
jgi:hypothetical protein